MRKVAFVVAVVFTFFLMASPSMADSGDNFLSPTEKGPGDQEILSNNDVDIQAGIIDGNRNRVINGDVTNETFSPTYAPVDVDIRKNNNHHNDYSFDKDLVDLKGSTNQLGIQNGVNNLAINGSGGGGLLPPVLAVENGNGDYPPAGPGIAVNQQAQKQKQGQFQVTDIDVDMTPIKEGMEAQANAHVSAALIESEASALAAEEEANAMVEAAKQSRDFANQLDPYTEQPAADYRGPWNAGPQVMKMSDILALNKTWMYDSTKKAKSAMFEGVRVKFRGVNDSPLGNKAADRITILPDTKAIAKGTKILVGFMYAQATGDEADTVLVLQKAAKAMCDEGANVAVLMGEGFTTAVDAKGGGIGLSYTQSFISDNAQHSGGGSGGTGFSVHKSGIETKPWAQFALYYWTSK